MNPQDIREKSFEKAVFGGYDMAQVDNYLGEVSTELSNSQREITVLKSKMKVLVEKIEEYRSNEDAMHMALLSAQKVSVQIQNEAEQKGAAMLESAQLKSEEILGGIRGQQELEQARLLEAKNRSAEFLAQMRQLCGEQLKFLDKISEAAPELDRMSRAAAAREPLGRDPAVREPAAKEPLAQETLAREARPAQEARPQERRAVRPSPLSPSPRQRDPAEAGFSEGTLRSIESSVSKLAEDPSSPYYASDYSDFDAEPEEEDAATKHFTPVSNPKMRLSFDDLRFDDRR
ncbi:MAG: DivIVA domain-containing protein [Firmicutes bacterium]|nr:DivIVA domain-containing protein [Bacillota bacterium]